jgi:hypothetical protein
MWYKFAKQGSLWSFVSPTFEQDVDQAIKSSIVTKTFTEDDIKQNTYKFRAGDFKVLDLNLFQDYFSSIPNNKIKDYSFQYVDLRQKKNDGQCARYAKRIDINEQNLQNLSRVISVLKHEIIHAIEGLIPYIANSGEIYSKPGDHDSYMFKNIEKDQVPFDRKQLEQELFISYLEDITGYMILGKNPTLSPEYFSKDDIKKARSLAKKDIRELDRRARSFHGDIDMYLANPSELRAFRAQFDNFFSMENLINCYKNIYENVENGKDLFLRGFYELIQIIVNVNDVEEGNSFFSNLKYEANDFIDSNFEKQVFKNSNPQYLRQMGKFLSDRYLEIKQYLESNQILPEQPDIDQQKRGE